MGHAKSSKAQIAMTPAIFAAVACTLILEACGQSPNMAPTQPANGTKQGANTQPIDSQSSNEEKTAEYFQEL